MLYIIVHLHLLTTASSVFKRYSFLVNNKTQSEDCRLLPRCRHLANCGRNVGVDFDFGPFAPICGNVTSSTKARLQSILLCRQMRTEPRPQITLERMDQTCNLVKFGHLVFMIYERTDRQTDIQKADRNTWYTYRGRRNNVILHNVRPMHVADASSAASGA